MHLYHKQPDPDSMNMAFAAAGVYAAANHSAALECVCHMHALVLLSRQLADVHQPCQIIEYALHFRATWVALMQVLDYLLEHACCSEWKMRVLACCTRSIMVSLKHALRSTPQKRCPVLSAESLASTD